MLNEYTDIPNKKRKETAVPTTTANPLQIPPKRSKQGPADPTPLSGSRGFVTMQLTVVLIREVWLWELRTYGFSKDIERFRVGGLGMPQSVEDKAVLIA